LICREGCGACCIALSITSPLPGMPEGKPAGVPCVNLDPETLRCAIWGSEAYPELCRRFRPQREVCGHSAADALRLIGELERLTVPG
jgi:Fe-S-cluster containining protein